MCRHPPRMPTADTQMGELPNIYTQIIQPTPALPLSHVNLPLPSALRGPLGSRSWYLVSQRGPWSLRSRIHSGPLLCELTYVHTNPPA